MKRFRDRRKVISLTLVGIAYALIVLPLIVNNLQKQQELRGKAQVATPAVSELSGTIVNQNNQSMCTADGNVELGLSYTNADKTRSMTVTATDSVTGKSVNFGTIAPEETKTATIAIGKNTVASGTVTYTAAYTENPAATEQKSASYTAKACTPATLSDIAKVTADAPETCGIVTTDVILIIDRSGSMGQNNKLTQAKNAAKNFIDVVSKQESTTRIGLVSFSTTSTLSSPLTTDITSLKSKIDGLTASGSTCHECGVKTANTEISSKGRAGVKKVVLLLTDGESNFIEGGSSQVAASVGEAKALDAVKTGFNQSNTVFFTIGFDIKSATAPQFLTSIASSTGGKYYFPAPNELDGVYQEISQLIGKGLIGGFVFNDLNINGAYDANEPKLSGWTVKASYAGGSKSVTTGNDGSYSLTGLCDGSYTLSQTMKSGWTQTLPANNQAYSIDINNASQFTNKIFGNTDKARCNDGLDNDNNGYKDKDDSTCHTDGNPKNPNSYDPIKDGERGGGDTCADSKDNNGDGTIDGGDPVCHTDGNPQNPKSYDPNLPEISTTTSMVCSPTKVSLSSTETPITVTLKNASNAPLSGKLISWTTSDTHVVFSPSTSQTNASGSASVGISIPANHPNTLNATITAKFAGTPTNSQASCTIEANYSPESTSINLNVLLDGIGSRGDNTNPTDSALSNKNPKHPTIGADIQVFSLDNQLIAAGVGSITYSSASGSYKGDIPVQMGFPSGKYTIKVKADTYLRKLAAGIQTVTVGQQNTITSVALVAGDVNNDNKLNILDYNSILDCYSDLTEAPNCAAEEKQVKSDINDDSYVNQIDYNLFLREISTQPGQ